MEHLSALQNMAVETFRDFEHLTPHLSYEHVEQDASFAALKNEGIALVATPMEEGFWVSIEAELNYREAILGLLRKAEGNIQVYISTPLMGEGGRLYRFPTSAKVNLDTQTSQGWHCSSFGYLLLEFRAPSQAHLKSDESGYLSYLSAVFLEACKDAFSSPKGNSHATLLSRTIGELKREAGRKLLDSLTKGYQAQLGKEELSHDIEYFEAFNKISALKHEGEIISGEIVFIHTQEDRRAIDYLLDFESPVALEDFRKVRKLFELSDPGESFLVLVNQGISGVGETRVRPHKREKSFSVEFNGHHKWELWKNGTCLMVVEYGLPRLKRKSISWFSFAQKLASSFNTISEGDLHRIWCVVEEAMKQRHGTMLVFSEEAESEAARLSAHCFRLGKPVNLFEKLEIASNKMNIVNHVTSIDGAVLLDLNCNCFAIGAILDGVVCEKTGGDASRGARYNSALRYHEHRKRNTSLAIVVVSEDGMVDLI